MLPDWTLRQICQRSGSAPGADWLVGRQGGGGNTDWSGDGSKLWSIFGEFKKIKDSETIFPPKLCTFGYDHVKGSKEKDTHSRDYHNLWIQLSN